MTIWWNVLLLIPFLSPDSLGIECYQCFFSESPEDRNLTTADTDPCLDPKKSNLVPVFCKGDQKCVKGSFVNSLSGKEMYRSSIVIFCPIIEFVLCQTPGEVTGCKTPQTPFNGNFDVHGCEGILKDPFFGPCWKNPRIKYPIGQKVSYFCSDGFILRGEKTVTCEPSGNWNRPFPRCCKRRGNNTSPDVVTLSRVPKESLSVFEKANEDPFETDNDQVSCPPMLRTNKVEFECMTPDGRLNDCRQPPFPPFTVAHLKCAKYYRSSGDLAYRYRKCKPDGVWSVEGSITCISDCGKSDISKKSLITNGVTSERGQWPWHAALYLRTSGIPEFICGGSLISKQVILTAAHCVTHPTTDSPVDPGRLAIILGKHVRQFGQKDVGEQRKFGSKIIVHPNYSPYTFDSDIAMIILDSPVEFSFHVRPVCFPESFNSLLEEYQIQEGNVGTVVGWGKREDGNLAETLQEAHIPVVNSRTCIESYKEFFESQTRYTNFCAGYTNGTGVCNGDSGGGMVFPSGSGPDQRYYIQGIVSAGVPDPDDQTKCDTRQYALFTRVGRYADWLVRTLTPDGYI
ncbi:unnamed protein product [Allacma fusca]|uniref:Limulus clotting factor C n=1 Tax=Allacma fusca TaxID=39272 RepID=A0A8J2KN54_9HEXA|nr:unnamed protein product [Allacma fusca]